MTGGGSEGTQGATVLTETKDLLDRIIRFLETHNGQRIAMVLYSVIVTAVLVFAPGSWAAYAFGLPYMFFVPGFAVVRLFFWKGTSLEARFVLSLGLSILVIIFLGLILVFSIGLSEATTRASLVLFTMGAVALDLFLGYAEKADSEAKPKEIEAVEPFKIDKVVAVMLGTALAVSAVSIGLIITADYPSTTFIAITDPDGHALNETSFALNESITIMVEMKNGEDGPRNFTLVAHAFNTTVYGVQYFSNTLEEGEHWFVNVTFELHTAGTWRLDFDLYIQEEGEPEYLYGSPHLWIEVE